MPSLYRNLHWKEKYVPGAMTTEGSTTLHLYSLKTNGPSFLWKKVTENLVWKIFQSKNCLLSSCSTKERRWKYWNDILWCLFCYLLQDNKTFKKQNFLLYKTVFKIFSFLPGIFWAPVHKYTSITALIILLENISELIQKNLHCTSLLSLMIFSKVLLSRTQPWLFSISFRQYQGKKNKQA